MVFYGRNEELNEMYGVLDSEEQKNILIYGQRRIGKSYLVRKALEKYNCKKIIYQCKNISEENTIQQLTNLIKEEFQIKYLSFNNIEEIFDFLFNQKDVIFFIDEYSYLQERITGIDSIIQQKIDKYKFESNLKLIISGSLIDVMRKIVEYSNPLYGRFNLIINLKEHNYLESSLYYEYLANEDKVKLYSVFGGEPFYNSLIDSNKTVEENIINLAIKDNSVLEMNILGSIKNEISKISCANEVLTAIALGKKKNKDIADYAHVDSATMNNALKKLISLDVVEKIKPINNKSDRKSLYIIKSNPIRFYYRYIYTHIEKRNMMNNIDFYNIFIKKDFLTQFIPNVYENISKQFLIIKNRKSEIKPAFYEIGTFYYDDSKKQKNGQFDVVTLDENGYIFYEVKYINDLVGDSILKEEVKQLQNLDINYYKLGFISKNGATLDEKTYNLFSLEDIYNA